MENPASSRRGKCRPGALTECGEIKKSAYLKGWRGQVRGRRGKGRDDESAMRCRVERSFLWKIPRSLAAAGNDLRVGNQLLFSKPKIVIKQTVFNCTHTKDPKPTSSIQR